MFIEENALIIFDEFIKIVFPRDASWIFTASTKSHT